MGNHHAEEDLEDWRRREAESERVAREIWDNLTAAQKVAAMERTLSLINERAVTLRDQIGHSDVFSALRYHLQVIVEQSRNYQTVKL